MPWLPPPRSTTRLERASCRCTVTAPWYGVAASPVAWNSSTGATLPLMTLTEGRDSFGQNAHGALYQALFQVMNGAFAYTFQLSARHRCQSRDQAASLHWTAA